MIAVIFELWPGPGQRDRYFELAAGLREELMTMEGFISIERFESVSEPGKFLSLSFWRDEAAVQAWRTRSRHRDAQRQGRDTVLSDYRLRVASVDRDYSRIERDQAPDDSNRAHDV